MHWAYSKDWSDWADAQVDLSLRWAHMWFCWFCHEAAHLSNWIKIIIRVELNENVDTLEIMDNKYVVKGWCEKKVFSTG